MKSNNEIIIQNTIGIALDTYTMNEGIAGGQSGALIINETFFAVGGNDGFFFL